MPNRLSVYTNKTDRRKANFIICPSCYWCASCVRANDDFPKCLQCKSEIVDSLPIFENEFYRLGFIKAATLS